MKTLLKNAFVYTGTDFVKSDLLIEDGRIVDIFKNIDIDCEKTYDLNNLFIFPGFTDVHVHLREPGFSYKETIKSGSSASARGGFTHIYSMPNLNPAPDSFDTLKIQLDIIEKDAEIEVIPYGTITKERKGAELSDMDNIKDLCIAFTDDGSGIQTAELMKKAMEKAKSLDKIIAAHCEDNSLLKGGYIHDGMYAKSNGHKGICSESEWGQIARDLELAKETGVKYHVCHISTKESVDIIRKAKKDGIDVTCETGPHYLVFNDMDLKDEGRFKMNPPIRSEEDRLALIKGIKDGTIDMIATDHAPHSFEEKSKGLSGSMMGVVGIETSFPVCYTHLVKKNIITLPQLIKLMAENPANRFSKFNKLEKGAVCDICIFDLEKEYEINPEQFISMGRSTPFAGEKVFGECIATIYMDKFVYGNLESYKEEI